MSLFTKSHCAISILILFGTANLGQAASQAKVHVAVYGSGFMVDTQRLVAYGRDARRVEVKSKGHGIASGEEPASSIMIDQLQAGTQTRLDPETKTYTTERYMASSAGKDNPSKEPAQFTISRITPTVTGPLGSDRINGFPSESFTIRVIAEFTDAKTGAPVATETLLEKLWVTKEAPAVRQFRDDEMAFEKTLSEKYGTEDANLRWLLREFNRQVLSFGGDPEDLQKLLNAYRGARIQVLGVTVRQVVAWTWEPKDASAPGAGEDMPQFIASLAAGLGAPPDAEGKKPLAPSMRPFWATEMEKDFGRSGSMVVMLDEVIRATGKAPTAKTMEVPSDYRKL